MTTTSESREKLRKAAEAATPGPWRTTEDGVMAACPDDTEPDFVDHGQECVRVDTFSGNVGTDQGQNNYDFIAAANPAVVLALLDDIDAAEGREARLRKCLADFVDPSPCHLDHHGACQEHGFSSPPCGVAEARDAIAQADKPTTDAANNAVDPNDAMHGPAAT